MNRRGFLVSVLGLLAGAGVARTACVSRRFAPVKTKLPLDWSKVQFELFEYQKAMLNELKQQPYEEIRWGIRL